MARMYRVGGFCTLFSTQPRRPASDPLRSGQSVRPTHLFGHNLDHDYQFEPLSEEERAAQSIQQQFPKSSRYFWMK